MRFVDQAEITVRSGHGGAGSVSFRREKYVPKGGPDGGDGGRGGDVWLVADNRLHTLQDFRLKRLYEAQNGQSGMGKQRHGRDGEDLVIAVPVGTLAYVREGDEAERPAADLTVDGQNVVLARGGRGGKGNLHFKSSTMRTPRFAQPGEDGVELHVRLELKILADVGLIGLPNAGKSTLLSALSAARPKIAPYPFTTLSPQLGVMEQDDGRRLIVADIPGLIEGAHAGLGLGHTFLRHVERTRFVVHVLSFEDIGAKDPAEGFGLVNKELALYSPELAAKPQLLVVNKIDLATAGDLALLREQVAQSGMDVHFLSALTGFGVEELAEAMWERFEELTPRQRDGEDNGV